MIDQPTDIRDGEALDLENLRSFLRENISGIDETSSLIAAQFPRGFSNLTYSLQIGKKDLVLRRPPFGAKIKSAHDMSREYKILSNLIKVYPKVPEPLAYCEDDAVIGAPFYIMERVKGVILRPKRPSELQPSAAQMTNIATAMIDTFVELHAVDFKAAGLADLGRPEGYVQRQIEGWIKRYQKAKTDDISQMESLARWLTDNMPPDSGAALIHNDYKYDNLSLNPDNLGDVIAVLDWEMATLGDPLMDLGTSLGYWMDPDDPPEFKQMQLSPTTLPGNPSRAEVAEIYARKSGRNIDQIVFYYAYGLYKIAVIVQQIYARYKSGHTSDPRFTNLIHAVRGCALLASQAVVKGRIDRLFV